MECGDILEDALRAIKVEIVSTINKAEPKLE